MHLMVGAFVSFNVFKLINMLELRTRDHLVKEKRHHSLLKTQLDHGFLELPLHR
jgi:hypothetical protein